jgi:hypothetical protein
MRIKLVRHGLSVLVLALFGLLALGSGTTETAVREDVETPITLSELREECSSKNLDGYQRVKEYDQGYAEGYIKKFVSEGYIVYRDGNSTPELSDSPDSKGWFRQPDEISESSLLRERVVLDNNKKYTFHFTVRKVSLNRNYPPADEELILDSIEGLMPLEEAQTIVAERNAQRKAKQEADEEARRLAEEEANRYDPAKFVIVPPYDFRPVNYTKADLFAAVAAAEKLNVSAIAPSGLVYPTPYYEFVSDVVFVSQNGTDITFKTADNAITKRMKVDSRTGLTAGQRVRIYYSAYRIKDWQVATIERL